MDDATKEAILANAISAILTLDFDEAEALRDEVAPEPELRGGVALFALEMADTWKQRAVAVLMTIDEQDPNVEPLMRRMLEAPRDLDEDADEDGVVREAVCMAVGYLRDDEELFDRVRDDDDELTRAVESLRRNAD